MAEPVTLSEVKEYMRIDADYLLEDDLIGSLLTAERMSMERELELSLVEKTGLVQKYNKPCCGQWVDTRILYGPVTSIVIKDKMNTVLDPVPTNYGSGDFPIYRFNQSIEATYNAGYIAANCPEDLKLALKMRVATAYKDREDTTDVSNNEVLNSSRRLTRLHARNIF